MKDFFNNIGKKLLAIKLVGGIIVASFPLLLLVVLLIAIISPILLFFDGKGSNYNPDGTIDRSKKTFENAILDREEYWKENGVRLDKELVLSVLLYGRGYNYDLDYELPENCDYNDLESCYADNLVDSESKTLIKYARMISDGMVKKQELWSCRHYEIERKEVCEEISMRAPLSLLKPQTFLLSLEDDLPNGSTSTNKCTIKEEKVYDDWAVCGYDDESLCDNTCDRSFETDAEIVYNLKTKQEFINWLKETGTDEFGDKGYNLAEKLIEIGYQVPTSGERREEILDEAIESMFKVYDLIKDTSDDNYFINIGDPYEGDYTLWSQLNAAWKDNPLGTNPGSTIGMYGCLATSLAAQIARSGTYINMDFLGADSFNPGTFIGRIRLHGAFNAGGSYTWNNPGMAQLAPNFIYLGQEGLSGSWNNKVSQIYSHLEKGHYLLLNVKNGGHWVAVTGITDENINIIDPGYYHWQTVLPGYDDSGVVRIAIYEKLD